MNPFNRVPLWERVFKVLLFLVTAAAWLFLAAIVITVQNKANAADIEAFAQYKHRSDLFRGWPLNDREETSEDFICGGITIRLRKFEVDMCHGVLTRDRGEREQGSEFALRWYPGRRN